MTLPVTTELLPASYSFGKVVGRVIHLIADTAEDTDDKPQARPGAGRVRFTPDRVLSKTVEEDYPAIVLNASTVAVLDSEGYISDAEGHPSIWLAVGVYRVSFEISGAPGAVPDFVIAVTSDHTDAAPLDLAVAVPYVPPTGATVQTIVIPAGGTDGQVLVRQADGSLRWKTVIVQGEVASSDIEDATATGLAVLKATDPAAARGAIGAASQEDVDEAIGAIDPSVQVAEITDATATGRAVLTAADKPAARAAIDAASQADVDEAIGAIDPSVQASDITDATETGRTVLTAPTKQDARNVLDVYSRGQIEGISTRKFEFDPGSSAGQRRYMRIMTLDGVNEFVGAGAAFLLAGTGDFGIAARGTLLVHFTQRADGVSVKAWAWDRSSSDDQIELRTKKVGPFVYELWAYVSDFNQTHAIHMLVSQNASMNLDSQTVEAPAGLSTSYYISDWDLELEPLRAASDIAREFLEADTTAAARAVIGAGTSNLALGTTATTAKAGNYAPNAAAISDATTVGRNVLKATDAAAARSAISAGRVDSSDSTVLNIVKITQAAYNALATKVATTLYVIQG